MAERAANGLRALRRAVPLAAQAEERIRGELLSEAGDGSERLVEGEIARRLEMSRTPVREALHRLALLGLIEPANGGGYVPRRFTVREVLEHYDLRIVLESEAAALAAARHRAGVDDVLAIGVEQDGSAHDAVAIAEVHKRIGERSGNPVLARVIRALNERSLSLRLYAHGSEVERETLDAGHRAVEAAIMAGDPDAARIEMTRHLEVVRDTMLAQLRARAGEAL